MDQRVVSDSLQQTFLIDTSHRQNVTNFLCLRLCGLVGTRKGNRFLGKPRRGQEDNVKTVLKEVGCEGVKNVR